MTESLASRSLSEDVAAARKLPLHKRPWTRPVFILLAAHALQLGCLVWFAAHAKFCCDATNYYIPAGYSIFHDGLLWPDPYAGYRFYFTPLIFGLLELIFGAHANADQIARLLPYALAGTFFLTSTAASVYVMYREGARTWGKFAIPLLLNPFVLAMVPYPLQESVVVIFCMPLLFLLLARSSRDFRTICAIATAFVGIAFVARSSLLWLIVPALLFVSHRALSLRPSAAHLLQSAALAMAVSAALLAPQCYISWHKFSSLNPWGKTTVAHEELTYGVEMLNYTATFNRTDFFSAFPVWSPYRQLAREEKNSDFYFKHSEEGLFLGLTHVWSGLHYVAVTPYVPQTSLAVISGWLVASAAIVAFGILGLLRLFFRPGRDWGLALFVLAATALSCAYTAFVATEARFGLWGFAALSIAAWLLLTDRNERRYCLNVLPLVVVYVALCVVINALLLYRTSALWPDSSSQGSVEDTDPPVQSVPVVSAIAPGSAAAHWQNVGANAVRCDVSGLQFFSTIPTSRGSNATDRA